MINLSTILFLLVVQADGNTEDRNKVFFDTKVALCKKSKCVECGRFYYIRENELSYNESFCETKFKMEEEVRQEVSNDAAIRAKYSKK